MKTKTSDRFAKKLKNELIFFDDLEYEPSYDDNFEKKVEIKSLRDNLETMLLFCRSKEKIVLKKYYFDGLKGPEIAKELGISKSRVYQIKDRAINKLRRLMMWNEGVKSLRVYLEDL